jgi:hypothetical protein
MHDRKYELKQLIKDALECSVYVAPTASGLSWSELTEIAKQLGYEQGEISDAIELTLRSEDAFQKGTRLEPTEDMVPMWDQFHWKTEPDFRSLDAFNHVRQELQDVSRKLGARDAKLERSILVERGVAKGLKRHDIEVAIQISLYTNHFVEKDGMIILPPARVDWPLPCEQLTRSSIKDFQRRPNLEKLHPIVQDIVERRKDGRSASVQALDAFAERLETLGHSVFRSWWIQMVAELRRLDVTLNPVATSVISAALVEGALTFVVKHARAIGIGPMGSDTFKDAPRTWKIDDLVKSAARGDQAAILDPGMLERAKALIEVRQRIHAGRMLVDYPTGVPDLRPEDARDAKQTADLVVRRIIDWVDRHPDR